MLLMIIDRYIYYGLAKHTKQSVQCKDEYIYISALNNLIASIPMLQFY